MVLNYGYMLESYGVSKIQNLGDFLGDPVVKNPSFNTVDVALICDQTEENESDIISKDWAIIFWMA